MGEWGVEILENDKVPIGYSKIVSLCNDFYLSSMLPLISIGSQMYVNIANRSSRYLNFTL